MKEDNMRMRLYLSMQDLKKLVRMPFLETVCDKGLSDVSFLEKELTACQVGLLVHDREKKLLNLLEEKYLYASDHSSAFLLRNHISVLWKSQNTEIDKRNPDGQADIVVYVIAINEDIGNAIEDIDRIRHTPSRPLIMFLFDSDGEADILKSEQHIAYYFESMKNEPLWEDEISYMVYSSLKAIQAQEMMDNQLMLESGFLSVKRKLKEMARVGLRKQLVTKTLCHFTELLGMCQEVIEACIHSHEDEVSRLEKIRQNTETIFSGFGDNIRQRCIDACVIDPGLVEFSVKPDDTSMAKNAVTKMMNEKIESEFSVYANAVITETFGFVEDGYNSYFSQLSQNLFWMETEDKIRFADTLALLQIDRKTFNFPAFRMNINDFSPIESSTSAIEVQKIMNDALQKALYEYNIKLRNDISKWLNCREEQYTLKVKALMDLIKSTVTDAVEEHHGHIRSILTSDTLVLLKKIVSDINILS